MVKKKINFKCTFCGFSFTPMSKCRKRPWNLYKYKNFLLKTNFSLIIEYGMYLKCLQKPRCLGWFKTSQALLSAVHKTRLNSSKDNFIAKSFRLSTKRKLSILLNFLFPFVSFIGVFSILSAKLWSWKLPHDERTPAILLMDDISRCQIGFFPHPLNGWQDHWTFEGEWVMGDFTDLVWEFFFSILRHERYFFQRRIFFPRNLFACFFPLEISLQDIYFFWNHPITCAK